MNSRSHPETLPDLDGVVHEVVYLDAVWWRAACSMTPTTKPKGWKSMMDLHITCLVCLAGPPDRWFLR